MNQDYLLKNIQRLLSPVRKDLKSVKQSLNRHDTDLGNLSKNLTSVKSAQSQFGKDLVLVKQTLNRHDTDLAKIRNDINTIKETQETHTSSLLTIETTIKAYGDMYKINDDNIRKVEKRTETLEEKAGIETPEELILLKVQ